jgi:hypothetical protein
MSKTNMKKIPCNKKPIIVNAMDSDEKLTKSLTECMIMVSQYACAIPVFI